MVCLFLAFLVKSKELLDVSIIKVHNLSTGNHPGHVALSLERERKEHAEETPKTEFEMLM